MLVYAALTWTQSDSYREYHRLLRQTDIPASNAYNPFGQAVRVYYTPVYEFDTGLLPQPHDRSDDELRTINVGFYWKVLGEHELNLDINRTKSRRESGGFRVDPDPAAFDPGAEAFYRALASPDPARALNFFGNGTMQGSAFDEFIRPRYGPVPGSTETRQYNLTLRGELFGMWGGPATYSLGGEYRENIIFWNQPLPPDVLFEEEWDVASGSLSRIGVERPSRKTEAYYAEFAFPFFSQENAWPGLRSLVLTAQARWDVDRALGSFGGRERATSPGRYYYFDVFNNYDGPSYNEGLFSRSRVHPNVTTQRNSRMSPRLGFHWKPVDTFSFRAAWSRSYTPPSWSDRFSTLEPRDFVPYRGVDPFAPGGPRLYSWGTGLGPEIRILYYADALDSEYSTHWSGSLEWLPDVFPGLRLRLDWSAVDYTNLIGNSRDYLRDYPEVLLKDPQIGVRDDEGNLTYVIWRNINIEERYNEIATAFVEYTFDTRIGEFRPAVQYMRYLDDYLQLTPEAPRDSELGTQRGQDRYRWMFSINWSWRQFGADVWAYYTPGYLNDRAHACPLSTGEVEEGSLCLGNYFTTFQLEFLSLDVSSLTTVDATLSYTLDNGLRIRLGGRNVLNRSFPRTVNGSSGFVPYDAGRWDARGRVLFIDLNWQM